MGTAFFLAILLIIAFCTFIPSADDLIPAIIGLAVILGIWLFLVLLLGPIGAGLSVLIPVIFIWVVVLHLGCRWGSENRPSGMTDPNNDDVIMPMSNKHYSREKFSHAIIVAVIISIVYFITPIPKYIFNDLMSLWVGNWK